MQDINVDFGSAGMIKSIKANHHPIGKPEASDLKSSLSLISNSENYRNNIFLCCETIET